MSDKVLLQAAIDRVARLKFDNPSIACPKDLDQIAFSVGAVECKYLILAILDELIRE